VRDSGVYADSPLATETEFGAFTSGVASVEDDFNGTPGGVEVPIGTLVAITS
jgi:hypothetical protein